MPAQPIRLYDGPAPGSEHWGQRERETFSHAWQTRVVSNVTDPTLTVYSPDPTLSTRTAVVIFPGGGFHALSIESEGAEVARWLAGRGVTGIVLRYRLVETTTDDPGAETSAKPEQEMERLARPLIPLAMADGLNAVAHVRQNAAEYGVDADRIGIIGFSAGGTIAASVAYNCTPESRPDFVGAIYPQYDWAISGEVPREAPPLFVLAATDDSLGLAPHSVRLYNDWCAAGNPAELHLYAAGDHGFGMRTQGLPSDRWIELFKDWMDALGIMSQRT